MKKSRITICLAIMCGMTLVNVASAELIRGINMDFVSIGNAGNADNPAGYKFNQRYGAVDYNYRIGKYEITNAQWNSFTAVAGVPTGNLNDAYVKAAYDQTAQFTGAQQPTNNVSWYEAAQFCNYLTSGNKNLGAYHLGTDGSIIVDRATSILTYGMVYVLPTENEWYKAAYYKPNGSGYSLYANGTNTAPIAGVQSNYYGAKNAPWNIGTGIQEQNGTYDMMGNVDEWNETFYGGGYRGYRGGWYSLPGYDTRYTISSSNWDWKAGQPNNESVCIGFRVVSVPEPCTIALLGLGGLILRRKK